MDGVENRKEGFEKNDEKVKKGGCGIDKLEH
ncbi:uncharacterized protein G2W53_019856 [Senna tora]|uniref:Uncharacterized protein n=1 Tax=Senna tora TaxID=362788 RepID=A0A834TUU1_9FABA|nr:uncharacterized protein G2W53_019856 [Senna tora]